MEARVNTVYHTEVTLSSLGKLNKQGNGQRENILVSYCSCVVTAQLCCCLCPALFQLAEFLAGIKEMAVRSIVVNRTIKLEVNYKICSRRLYIRSILGNNSFSNMNGECSGDLLEMIPPSTFSALSVRAN